MFDPALVDLRPLTTVPDHVCGVDAAYIAGSDAVIGAAVVLERPGFEAIDSATAQITTGTAYKPGKLGLRESPAVVAAVRSLHTLPSLVVCDGHGYAHPTRSGLACHVGVALGVPTIGCAKNHLIGDYVEPGDQRGDWSPLIDDGETIGAVVRTQSWVKPLFVSPGHLCDVASSVAAVLLLAPHYRLPETTRAADRLANDVRKELLG